MTNDITKQKQTKKRDSKPGNTYKKRTTTDSARNSDNKRFSKIGLKKLKSQEHTYRAEARSYGQVFDKVDEITDLETVLSFCKKFYGQEFQCAVVLFIDNEEVRYFDYIDLMKKQYPELRRILF